MIGFRRARGLRFAGLRAGFLGDFFFMRPSYSRAARA
jgi:hypothetical protein